MKALITGASSGIGKDIAKYLASLGYDLIIVGRRKENLLNLKKELKVKVKVMPLDLSEFDNVEELYNEVKNDDIDILINNAGFGLFGEFSKTDIEKVRKAHPGALLLVHPECRMEVLEDADYIGSTSGIIEYASESDAKEFIIGTEPGVMYELERRNPGKKFYPLVEGKVCPDMKKITLEKVLKCMEEGTGVVEVTEELRNSANASLDRMLELAR